MLDQSLQWFRRFLRPPEPEPSAIGLLLSGGGARAAYQAGVLQYIAEAFPEARLPILTGVSAGAINIAHLANHTGSFAEAARELMRNWEEIRSEDVFEAASSLSVVKRIVRRTPGAPASEPMLLQNGHGLLGTAPLRAYLKRQLGTADGRLDGVTRRLREGSLDACAFITTSYTTGQTVTWVQGRDIQRWERPMRISVQTALTVDHIMASTALPVLFPAVPIGDQWYGDGGIRLTAPLSPAIHLGADRILAISTRYKLSKAEADEPMVYGYPPAAQIIGILMNAIFLDMLDQDAATLGRVNALIRKLPRHKRDGLRPVKLLLLRPSVDLGKLASGFELSISGALGLLTRGLGSSETKSPDWLSMLLFDGGYVSTLIEIGYHDARRQHDSLAHFFEGAPDEELPQYAPAGSTRSIRFVS